MTPTQAFRVRGYELAGWQIAGRRGECALLQRGEDLVVIDPQGEAHPVAAPGAKLRVVEGGKA